jgi:Tfp pilus assembly protein FimT
LAAGASVLLKGYFVNEDIRQVALRLQSSLMMARSEAIKIQGRVDIESADDGLEFGWIVTSDQGTDSYTTCTGVSPAATCILVIQNTRPVAITASTSTIAFNSFGRLSTGSSETFTLCDPDNSSYVTKRVVTVGLTGFPKITTDGDCSL